MQKDLIYINIGTKGLVDASGKAIRSTSAYPTIERGQWQVLCINFVQVTEDDLGVVTVTPVDISGSSYLFVADNNFDDDDNLMLKSYQSTVPFDQTAADSNRINIEGDWVDGSTADLTLGQMSIRIYSDTTKFVEALGNKQQVTSGLYANIKQYIPGLSAPSSVAWFPFIAKNTVRDWGDVQEVPPSGESLVPFIDAYLKQPTEYQFSVDGVNWHLGQNDDDRYYRQRIANISADWGESVKMIVGTDGEDGLSAGFGTPVLNVATGEPGTQASGTIDSSGDNTAKVFTFNLTIPQGATGNAAGFGSITATAETIPSDYQASAVVTPGGTNEAKTLAFKFQIPQGAKGDTMKIDATGTAAELAQYDAELKGFAFLATDTGMVYIKNSDTSGDWSEPVGFQGPPGKDGDTPERGVDYWTEDDISTIKSYVDEAIINGEW